MSRINYKMSAMEMVHAISSGLPGTIAVLAGIKADFKKVDPENGMDIFGYLLTMDMFQIYDGSLWNIHSKLCDMQIVKTIAILRSLQLGIFSIEDINFHLQEEVKTLDFAKLITEIRSIIGDNFASEFEM